MSDTSQSRSTQKQIRQRLFRLCFVLSSFCLVIYAVWGKKLVTNLKYLKTLFPRILSHFMSGPKGNDEFCFTETSMFPKAKLIITLRIVIHKIIPRPLRSAYISTTLKLPSLYLIFQGSQAFKSFQNPSANLKYIVTDNAGERDLPVLSAYGSKGLYTPEVFIKGC